MSIGSVATLLCLAYILGLLLSGVAGSLFGLSVGVLLLALLSAVAAVTVPRYWRSAPVAWAWLLAGGVGIAASVWLSYRSPAPAATDICHWIPAEPPADCAAQPLAKSLDPKTLFNVEGKLLNAPRLTRSGGYRLELAVSRLSATAATAANSPSLPNTTVSGKLYVTLPQVDRNVLYPDRQISLQGRLYLPPPAATPGGFDFQNYLARSGIFAGLRGQPNSLRYLDSTPAPPLWRIQQQIVQVQSNACPPPPLAESVHPVCALISAIGLGKGAVDLPYALRDQFTQVGLAHVLAASGAQVAMLIGVVLAVSRSLPAKLRLALGTIAILLYVGLTGLEAAILRAAIMGIVGLLALTLERRVKPIALLLLTATGLLLWEPGLIWDLGFQLSFLATLGLMVTVPALEQSLDWLPPVCLPLLSVPIAAYLWTLPLQLFHFGVVSPYSIAINVAASPLVFVISIGSMISAIGALVHAGLGSWLSSGLTYPTQALIGLVEASSRLPGTQVAVGTIGVLQLIALYGLILLVWGWRRLQPRWWLAFGAGLLLVMLPAIVGSTQSLQVTLLKTSSQPILVLQDHGKVTLVHGGSPKDMQFTVLPFLQRQGINRIDWAIDPRLSREKIAGWQHLLDAMPIGVFYARPQTDRSPQSNPATMQTAYRSLLQQVQAQQGITIQLTGGQTIALGKQSARLLLSHLDWLQLRIGDRRWLWLSPQDWRRQTQIPPELQSTEVLWWTGHGIDPQLLKHIRPQVAIATSDQGVSQLSSQNLTDWQRKLQNTWAWLAQKPQPIPIYQLDRDGTIAWSPDAGFVPSVAREP